MEHKLDGPRPVKIRRRDAAEADAMPITSQPSSLLPHPPSHILNTHDCISPFLRVAFSCVLSRCGVGSSASRLSRPSRVLPFPVRMRSSQFSGRLGAMQLSHPAPQQTRSLRAWLGAVVSLVQPHVICWARGVLTARTELSASFILHPSATRSLPHGVSVAAFRIVS
jgi:hypothetical protein